jgi:hypothetical protein
MTECGCSIIGKAAGSGPILGNAISPQVICSIICAVGKWGCNIFQAVLASAKFAILMRFNMYIGFLLIVFMFIFLIIVWGLIDCPP